MSRKNLKKGIYITVGGIQFPTEKRTGCPRRKAVADTRFFLQSFSATGSSVIRIFVEPYGINSAVV